MSAKYDPAACEQLIATARSGLMDDDDTDLNALVDQLAAARRELADTQTSLNARDRRIADLEAFKALIDRAAAEDAEGDPTELARRVRAEHKNQSFPIVYALAGQVLRGYQATLALRARVAELETSLGATLDKAKCLVDVMLPVVEASEAYVYGDGPIGAILDTVTAYRAALGKADKP